MNIESYEALLEEEGEISWAQLVAISGLAEPELRELVEDGAIPALATATTAWRFQARSILVARTAGRLRRELDLDTHGLAVVMRLLSRIEELQAQVRALQAGAAKQR